MFQNNIKPKLILFCGLPGSGKTTIAKKLEKELPAVRLCPDEWMAGLDVDLFDEAIRNNLEVQLWGFAQGLLGLGYNVILENGLWSRKEREDKLQDTAELNVEVELHYLNVPFEELIRRLENRNTSGDPNTVPLTREHMEGYAQLFQAPNKAEMARFTRAFVYDGRGKPVSALEQALLSRIRALPKPRKRPLIIAISGFGGSGKTTLAAVLKEQLINAEVVAADDFIIHQLKGRSADWSNHDRLRLQKQVLEPASHGEDICYQRYDWPNDRLGEWRIVPPSQYLIVEGQSVLHPDLRQFYDFKIWIDCALETAMKRGMERAHRLGVNQDDLWLNVWAPNDRDFLAKYHPDKAADITFNTN